MKPPAGLIDAAEALTAMPEETLADVAAKEAAFARLHGGANWLRLKTACDTYVVAFFTPKIGSTAERSGLAQPLTPETDHVWMAARGQSLDVPLLAEIERIAQSVSAFHWPLEFPAIMARGGFDVVIGNPPWERIKLQDSL